MKRAIFIAALAVFSTAVAGEPLTNADTKTLVNNYDKAPRVLPGSPQAAAQAPKYSIVVPCTRDDAGKVACVDVSWVPVIGPHEYVLMPMSKPAAPVVIEKEKIVTVVKEVPAKKIKE